MKIANIAIVQRRRRAVSQRRPAPARSRRSPARTNASAFRSPARTTARPAPARPARARRTRTIQGDAWKYVAKGTCASIKTPKGHGSLTPIKAANRHDSRRRRRLQGRTFRRGACRAGGGTMVRSSRRKLHGRRAVRASPCSKRCGASARSRSTASACRWPAPHEPDPDHLAALKRLVDRFEPELVSEHLAWSRLDGRCFPDLLPVPRTNEVLGAPRRQYRPRPGRARPPDPDRKSQPIISRFSDHQWSETSFLAELARRSGCGLLIDVNNVAVGAHNLGYDPAAWLDAIPAKLVGEIHLAGHSAGRRRHAADRQP